MGPADTEDAAQEAIVRGMQAWPALRDERSFKSIVSSLQGITHTVRQCVLQ
jgi:hypothetical protein